jgi:sensor histidine kinase YesM
MFQIEKTYQGWSWERVSRHVLYWMAWLILYAATNSTHLEGSFLSWTGVELMIMGIKLPFTYFVIYYLVPNYLLTKRYATFFPLFILFSIVGGIVIWVLYHYYLNATYFNYQAPHFWTTKIIYKVIDLIYISSLPMMFKLYQQQHLQEKRATQLVEQKLGAELKILKNQLHPHFLFNTLNNLYGMVLTQHPQAAEVVVRLSNMMSYMLYDCERPQIDLEKEIENLQNYVELEKIRYGKRLEFSFELGGEVAGKRIAPLLLLPFLENAFKHGAETDETKAWIRINLWVENGSLTYLVENSIPTIATEETMPKTQSGVGLANVHKRLALLYPDSHELEITRNDTYLVTLKLNLDHEMPHR